MIKRTFETVMDHEIEGVLYLVPTTFGGRRSAVQSGYRGQFFWQINGEVCTDWLAETFFEGEALELGESSRVKIKLAGTILDHAKAHGMEVGRQFCLREGARVIAVGLVTHFHSPESRSR